MNNNLKFITGIAAIFLFMQVAVLILISATQLLWPQNPGSDHGSGLLNYLIFSLSNLGVIVLLAIVFINAGKQEHEKQKAEAEQTRKKEHGLEESERYNQSLQNRLLVDKYDKAVKFFKYLHKTDDCNDPKTGLPDKDELEKINQLLTAHMNIISNQQNIKHQPK